MCYFTNEISDSDSICDNRDGVFIQTSHLVGGHKIFCELSSDIAACIWSSGEKKFGRFEKLNVGTNFTCDRVDANSDNVACIKNVEKMHLVTVCENVKRWVT